MKQRPAKPLRTTRPGPRRMFATACWLAAPAAFAYDEALPAAPGETGLWFIALMAVFVAVIFAGLWLHARDERPPPQDEPPRPPNRNQPRRAARWPTQGQGEPR